jgi:tetratricopeptide (TPR) repeat protein
MRGTNNRKAYELLQEGVKAMTFPAWTLDDFQDAFNCFANAVVEHYAPGSCKGDAADDCDVTKFDEAIDSAKNNGEGYWRAFSWLSYCLVAAWLEGFRTSEGNIPFGDLPTAEIYAKLGESTCSDRDSTSEVTDYVAVWCLGFFYLNTDSGQKQIGLDYYERAVAVNGDNNMNLLSEYGEALIANGRHDEALTLIERAKRGRPWYRVDAAWAYYFKGQKDPRYYRLAIAELRQIGAVPGDTEYPHELHLIMAASYAKLGDVNRAGRSIKRFLMEKPGWTLSQERDSVPFLEAPDFDHWISGCRDAGLP